MEVIDYTKKEFTEEELIDIAKNRIKIKRELYSHIAAYIFVNGFLVFIHFLTIDEFKFNAGFWPIWVIGAWGLGLLFHIFETIQELRFKHNAMAINRELEKIKRQINSK